MEHQIHLLQDENARVYLRPRGIQTLQITQSRLVSLASTAKVDSFVRQGLKSCKSEAKGEEESEPDGRQTFQPRASSKSESPTRPETIRNSTKEKRAQTPDQRRKTIEFGHAGTAAMHVAHPSNHQFHCEWR